MKEENIIKKLKEQYYKKIESRTTSISKFVFQQNDIFFDIFDQKPVFNVLYLIKRKYYLDDKDQFFIDGVKVHKVNGLNPWDAFSKFYSEYLVTYYDKKDEILSYPKITKGKMLTDEKHFFQNEEFCYIKLESFENRNFNFLFNNQGKKIVIDLRDNSGGSISVMLRYLDIFVTGFLFCLVNKEKKYMIKATSNKKAFFSKIVIIVNENTASSAEIFTDVLRKKADAIVIGKTTFGKWVTHKAEYYNDYFVKVPVFIYEDIKGVRYQNLEGIKPDYIDNCFDLPRIG